MEFVAIDFETANAKLSSICQVGITVFGAAGVTNSFSSLVDPEDYFDGINVSIHGIDAENVKGAPTFGTIYATLNKLTENKVVVSHTSFDRVAYQRACERYKLNIPICRWLDTACVVRRAWPEYARRGYGLKNVADHFGIKFNHHDALEDSRAAGEILLRAISDTGYSIDDWFVRVTQPISPDAEGRISRDGNPEGAMHGEVITFTGMLSMPRREAADAAASIGCEVDPGVTKRTTVLVVGDQDLERLRDGETKSSKHLKAEAWIAKGHPIRILQETDFLALVRCATEPFLGAPS